MNRKEGTRCFVRLQAGLFTSFDRFFLGGKFFFLLLLRFTFSCGNMTEEDLVDYSPDPLEEGIFRFASVGHVGAEVEATGHFWLEVLVVSNPSPVVGDGLSPSDYLLSSPRNL